MKFLLATLPDDVAAQARWLEEHLLGLDLSRVVSELKALGGGRSDESVGIDAALGDVLPQILRSGLSQVAPVHIQTLLKNPMLLLELQTRIFLEGGEYWNDLPEPSSELQDYVDRGRDRIHDFLATQSGKAPSADGGRSDVETTRRSSVEVESGRDKKLAAAVPERSSDRRTARWYKHPLLVSLTTAAAVLAGVFFVKDLPRAGSPPVAQGWGWSKPGAIDESLPAKEYLAKLSDGADDWFKKRPATPDALARRILEFRQGCSTLILSEHRPLKEVDKAWLVERCQAWAKKLDGHLADAESGKDVLKVREETDETVNKLKKALADRSQSA